MLSKLKRINWKLLLIHLLAIPCFIIGGQQLQLIRWVPMMNAYQASGVAGMQQESGTDGLSGTISQMWFGPHYAWVLAVLAGCLLSGLVVWRRRESKLIPVLLFGLAIITSWTHYYESAATHKVLYILRRLFLAFSASTQLLLVGSVLILMGLLLFLLTWKRPVEPVVTVI